MQMLLAFVPFVVFALLTRVTGVDLSLWAAAAVSLGLVVRDRVAAGGSIKVLEAGTVLLFGSLALYTTLTQAQWSIVGVRIVVDVGLLAIIVASMAFRRPFTLQYARQQVSAEVQNSPLFWHVNYTITAVWAAAMAVVVAVDLALECVPDMPLWIGTLVLVAALYGAFYFTRWYPAHRTRRAA
jgi:hypothetical protein